MSLTHSLPPADRPEHVSDQLGCGPCAEDSFNWEFAGRAAALTELTGYPEWFGPGEGPNEHDLVLLADGKTLMVVTRIDGNDGGPPYCSVRHTPKNYHHSFSSDGERLPPANSAHPCFPPPNRAYRRLI